MGASNKRGRTFLAVNRATAGVLAVVVAVVAIVALVVIHSGSEAPIRSGDGWVTVGSVEEVEEPSVLYLKEHELFVATTATVPEGFVALSAWTPATEDGDEPRRLLYCTLSNLFETQHGDLYDRAGHPLEETSRASMSRIPLRVRDGVVEVAPARAARNDLDRGTYFHGPPCGQWGEVVEGPSGYALTTDAPAGASRVTIRPARLKAGQRAKLRFSPGRRISGLRWDLYQLDDGLWQWRGLLVAGPGYESYFDLAPLDPGGGIDDIGFRGTYSVHIRIPKLDPGAYRLATNSLTGGSKPVHERTEWHYADFEVVSD